MKHVEFSIRRPVTITMVFVALAAIGLISSRLLPLEFFPDIEIPVVAVIIPYENSTPKEVERLITRPVEESLATLSGLKRMSSTSNENQSQVLLFFDWYREMGSVGIEARGKVDAIRHRLPADIRRVQVFTMSTGDQPIVILRVSSNRDLSDAYAMLDRNVKRRLERLPGVSKVELQGVEAQEIRILMDAGRIAAHGVNLPGLKERLEKSNFAVSGGLVTAGDLRMSLRPRGEFRSIKDIQDLVIDESGLRLLDVAQVSLTAPERDYGRHLNGKYAIGINVFKSTGANMVDVADRVLQEVQEIGELPDMRGINIFELDNQANGVRQSLRDLLQAGMIGALLAIAVLYIFLRQWTSTLIVTLSVPFSLMITLGALYFAGQTLNILTMMGLMLAIGMLVDNSVVITESVFRQRQNDSQSPTVATVKGVREVGLAVIAGTMTTVAVYIPLVWGGQTEITIFMKSVGLTITVAVVISLILAQTLIPMLAARIPPPKMDEDDWLKSVRDRYLSVLSWSLNHRWRTAGIIVLVISSVFIPGKLVDFEFFPEEPSRRLFLRYELNGIYPLERVEQAVDQVEGFLLANKDDFDVRDVYTFWNEGRAESTILLTEEDEIRRNTDDVMDDILRGMPEIVIGKPVFKVDRQGASEGFSIQLTGESTDQLVDIGYDVLNMLDRLDKFDGLTWDMLAGQKEVQVKVDGERAAKAGLSADAVAQSIQVAMKGDHLRDFRSQSGDTRVRIAFRATDKQTIQDLRNLPLYSPDGERVTLGSVADVEVRRGPRRIQRTDRQTSATISGDLSRGETMEDVRPIVKKLLDDYAFPPGYSWKFGRGFQMNDESEGAIITVIFLGIALIYLVMAALFESILFPIAIVLSIAFSIVGVFWTLLITGTTFSLMAYIGILILMGIVVNNGIVLVDYVNSLRLEGRSRDEAILEAGRKRLRPILMTVATTVLGLMPLAFGDTGIGGDGPAYFPMARTIIGGLLFSTVVSLLVVPYFYALFDDLVNWWRRVILIAKARMATQLSE